MPGSLRASADWCPAESHGRVYPHPHLHLPKAFFFTETHTPIFSSFHYSSRHSFIFCLPITHPKSGIFSVDHFIGMDFHQAKIISTAFFFFFLQKLKLILGLKSPVVIKIQGSVQYSEISGARRCCAVGRVPGIAAPSASLAQP